MDFNTIINKLNNVEYHGTNNDHNASMFVGSLDEKRTIIFAKPQPFLDMSWKKQFQKLEKSEQYVKKVYENTRFMKYRFNVLTPCEISVVHPASDEDVSKYIKVRKRFTETAAMHFNVIRPKIENQDITWIRNILDGKKEQEHIVYSDDDFVFMPDIKWDREDPFGAYYLAIVRDINLKSIRDLGPQHMALLDKIRTVGLQKMKELHGFNPEDVRMYFHYYPSFWHLHVHFNLCRKRYAGVNVDNCHLLNTVMNNIKMVPDYYQKVDLDIKIDPGLFPEFHGKS